jgi:hypothetical protein
LTKPGHFAALNASAVAPKVKGILLAFGAKHRCVTLG